MEYPARKDRMQSVRGHRREQEAWTAEGLLRRQESQEQLWDDANVHRARHSDGLAGLRSSADPELSGRIAQESGCEWRRKHSLHHSG